MTHETAVALKWLLHDVDARAGALSDMLPLLAVSIHWGVRRRDHVTGDLPRAEDLTNYKTCRQGDLVLNRMRAFQGALGIAPCDGLVSPDYSVLRLVSGCDPRWLVSMMKTPEFLGDMISRLRGIGGTESGSVRTPRINTKDLLRIKLNIPPLDEQRRIADYLDRETAQIDALIAKQEQLIETLRERRQAVLDTAFEALEAKRVQLRRGIRFLTSGSRGWGDYYADEGERFLRIGNLPRTNLTLRGGIQYVQIPPGVTEGSRTRLRRDDLLFSITAYLGSVAVVTDEWVGAYVSQHVALCRLDPSTFDPQFVGYFMLTTEGQDQLKLGAAGGTKVQLALDDIKALSVPLTPLRAQGKIVASIEVQVSRIDALIAKAEEFIGLARERRAALIAEAVTGRIDVSTGKTRGGA
ncbi:restriction endonuclease subunit S [Micromonospora chalcea]|uniref:restriction endonuclease subunit S n=1 Tax=Micromonospora chalcea TaxID=1874 RepID=UPI0021A7BECA|nr:restriction endonuclease subunit S [Micromonospora chalcea]MCT2281777.1 restriction endonuclease subunit S [Micromonospora chalcea]